MKNNPESIETLVDLGMLFENSGQMGQAVQSFEKALEIAQRKQEQEKIKSIEVWLAEHKKERYLGKVRCVKTFTSADAPISDKARWDNGELVVAVDKAQTLSLFKIPVIGIEWCRLVYQFRVKTTANTSSVTQQMIYQHGDIPQFTVDSKQIITGTNDWTYAQSHLSMGSNASAFDDNDALNLNLVFGGTGEIRIKDIEVWIVPNGVPYRDNLPVQADYENQVGKPMNPKSADLGNKNKVVDTGEKRQDASRTQKSVPVDSALLKKIAEGKKALDEGVSHCSGTMTVYRQPLYDQNTMSADPFSTVGMVNVEKSRFYVSGDKCRLDKYFKKSRPEGVFSNNPNDRADMYVWHISVITPGANYSLELPEEGSRGIPELASPSRPGGTEYVS